MKTLLLIAGLTLSAAPALSQTPPVAPSAPTSAPAAIDYSSEVAWLCLPGRQDVCARPLPTADLNPGGYGPVRNAPRAENPPIDCFYVYPTVSRDPALNSDMTPGIEEQGAATVQFGRFASVCRTFAPIYRQATLASIPRALAGQDVSANFNLAYQDVRAAWQYYLQRYNNGRPFVLIGHSQGSIHLSRLIAAEIDGTPLAAKMVSALLLGWAVEVPEGAVVGGTFRHTPLCTRSGQTGCIVTYMSFRAGSPPPANALLGRAARPGMTAGCTNPASLGGGSAPLDSYWFAQSSQFGGAVITWSTAGPPPAPFLHARGLISGECRHDGRAGYLAITVNADPNDARTDVIPGDVYFGPQLIPGWGLHLGDTSYALGDLIRVVAAQRDALARRRRRP
jgi:hypothetical protein